MRLWRLTRRVFIALDGKGAEQFGGRWNNPGRPMVYTALEASLAVLEIRVHLDLPFDLLPEDYVLVEIDTGGALVEDGRHLAELEDCAAFGDRWLAEQRSPLLSVPSVVVPQSRNVLMNPLHAQARAITIHHVHEWRFDSRLF